MSLLAAAALRYGRRFRGPFSVSTGDAGSFTPSGAEFTAAQAVYTALGASGYIYGFDSSSLRATEAGVDGIASGPIGYANDWRNPDDPATAAKTEITDNRPTLTTIDSVLCASFDGADDDLLWPAINWASGTIVLAARMTDATAANQTIIETALLRLQSQFTGETGPVIRDGETQFYGFGLSSMLDRWSLFVIQWNTSSGRLRRWYDAGASWLESTVTTWDNNIDDGSWTRGAASIIGKNSFAGGSAPFAGGVKWLIAMDTDNATVDQVQDLVDLAVVGTSISATVPAYPDGSGDPSEEELPTPLSEVTIATQGAFDTWKAGPPPAGQHATLTFNVNLGTLAFSGTLANPIVIKASSVLGRNVTGCGDITGDNIRISGFDWAGVSPGLMTGLNTWLIRCKGTNGLKLRFRAQGGRAWYCWWNGGSGTRAIAYDTANNAGGTGRLGIQGHVKGCLFDDWAPSGANATETITVGFSSGRTLVVSDTIIEDCLFVDCNEGGSEDETIAIKSSSVTVRDCTFIRTRWCQVRHGINNTIERCWHENSSNGGFRIRDHNARLISCKTVGGSGTEVFAGDSFSGEEDPDWPDTGAYPRAHDCIIDHHDAADARPVIGKQFSTAFSPSRAAEGTLWRSNRGLTPNLALETNTTVGGAASGAHVAPVKLTTADVGPNA